MAIYKLNPTKIAKLTKNGMYGDGGGLSLQVTNNGAAKSWIFRWKVRGTNRSRTMGLGALHTYDIHQAREKARLYRLQLDEGKDPLAERDGVKVKAEIAAARAKTMREVVDEWYDAKISRRRPATRKSVIDKMNRHVFRTIGDMPIQKVDKAIILDDKGVGLRRLWSAKPENGGRHASAIHLQGYLERVFKFAIASKYYDGPNPAAWRGYLEYILPASRDVHKVEHQPSLPHRDAGRFLEAVRAHQDKIGWGRRRVGGHPTVALLLEYLILSGVRISEGRLATWDEIDKKNREWIVPKEHHKAGEITDLPHRVPITKPMWDVLVEMERRHPDHAPNAIIFPSPRDGKAQWRNNGRPFAVDAVAALIRDRIGWNIKVTAHGFRSTLTDWARANEYFPDFVHMQVGHIPRGKVDKAYMRDQLVNERRPMMEAWGADRRQQHFGARGAPRKTEECIMTRVVEKCDVATIEPLLCSVAAAMAIIGRGQSFVIDAIATGKIQGVKSDRRTLVWSSRCTNMRRDSRPRCSSLTIARGGGTARFCAVRVEIHLDSGRTPVRMHIGPRASEKLEGTDADVAERDWAAGAVAVRRDVHDGRKRRASGKQQRIARVLQIAGKGVAF